MSAISFQSIYGSAADPFLNDLARLRIEVFHAFPYLYEGSLVYEKEYLQTYFQAKESLVVLAKDGEKIVGASTAIPLVYEEDELKEAFRNKGIASEDVMYFGESILVSKYRGKGVGKEFFKRRLAHANSHAKTWAAFCAVLRADDHPMKPQDYQPLDSFWKSQGFHKEDGMIGSLHWLDRGDAEETTKPMQFWLRNLKE